MVFRIGINLGDVLVHGEDLLGDGVNVAARIQTIAPEGGICVSGSVFDQIEGKLDLRFQSLGEQAYKNIGRPVRTFTVTSDGGRPMPSTVLAVGSGAAGRRAQRRWVLLVRATQAGGSRGGQSRDRRGPGRPASRRTRTQDRRRRRRESDPRARRGAPPRRRRGPRPRQGGRGAATGAARRGAPRDRRRPRPYRGRAPQAGGRPTRRRASRDASAPAPPLPGHHRSRPRRRGR